MNRIVLVIKYHLIIMYDIQEKNLPKTINKKYRDNFENFKLENTYEIFLKFILTSFFERIIRQPLLTDLKFKILNYK